MILIKFNNGLRAIDKPLYGKDWIIRFESDMVFEVVIRAYRDPSDAYIMRRTRAILRGAGLDSSYKAGGDVCDVTELFLDCGLVAAKSLMGERK